MTTDPFPRGAVAGRPLVLAVLLVAIAGCRGEDHRRLPGPPLPVATAGPPRVEPAGQPRPLVVVMTELESRMSDAASGLWREDYAAITRSGVAIARHPEILPEEQRGIRQVLGRRYADFEGGDRAVHEAAQLFALAGRRRDLRAAELHFEAIQQSCIGCHTAVRAAVRTARPAP